MLPELVLDNENFDEIMDEARNMIISLYPEWTDFNYHDPGITLIEMFSWIKESQQFFLDQISRENKEKYLKLLGIIRKHKIPATALVKVKPDEDITVLEGTRLYAGDVCFESKQKKQLIEGDVAWCFSGENTVRQESDKEQIKFGYKLRIGLFGDEPKAGNCFYIGFRRGLPKETELSIFMEIINSREVKRNPLKEPLPFPLAKLQMQYYGDGDWKNVENFKDDTYGAITSGQMYFELQDTMEELSVFGEQGYYLRLLLEQEDYDVPPMIQEISMNVILLKQQERVIEKLELESSEIAEGHCFASTIMALNGRNNLYVHMENGYYRINKFTKSCNFDTGITQFDFPLSELPLQADGIRIISHLEENMEMKLLDKGNEFPLQEYELNDLDIEYDSFELMIQDGDNPQCYRDWKKVTDFSNSGPEDRHYMLDTAAGILRFGDCVRGMAPEGDIIIVSYVKTLGRRGNVKAYKIDHFDGLDAEDIKVYNSSDSNGGRDEESLPESFLRAKKELKFPITAVSNADYERRVMETPGLMLEGCKVISSAQMRLIKNTIDETEINIVVKPYSPKTEKGLSAVYKNNIRNYLEQFRMVGRKINLLSPRYITFEVYGDIVVFPHFVDAREIVQETVNHYFSKMKDQFGMSVQYCDLYGIIDILSCVSHINSLTVDAKGSGIVRNKDGTIRIPPNGVVRLGNVQYLFSIGE